MFGSGEINHMMLGSPDANIDLQSQLFWLSFLVLSEK